MDIYSKLLIILDFIALLLLRRYLERTSMLVLFVLLLVMLWIWLYRVFSPLGFGWSALVSALAAVGLYIPNAYIRIVSLAFVIPAIAAATTRLVKPETELPGSVGRT